MPSHLLINEPPLQVLPSLALIIGLNEAIVLQQLHYLLRNPQFGKRIAEEQWIFNTVEQWRASYFPFWSIRTIKTVFTNLSKLKVIATCQPEGRLSRRKYYRIDMAKMEEIADRAKIVPSIVQDSSLPTNKDFSSKRSKESKETFSCENASHSSEKEHEATWKPIKGTKEQQLRRIETPFDFPDEKEFDEFITDECLDHIGMGKRGDLYRDLCLAKWHQWTGRKWRPIRDWQAFVKALDAKMDEATTGGF